MKYQIPPNFFITGVLILLILGTLSCRTQADKESSSFDLLWKPWYITGDESSAGLSWFLGKSNGVSTVSHAGGDTGFRTNLLLLPEKSIEVVVLCNLISSPIFEVTNAALGILPGYEPETFQTPTSDP